VPNYFGLQRFGAIRPVTHRVGEWILRGNYEQAVLMYVGMEFPGEPDEIKAIRSAFSTTRDPVPALHALPVQMNYERAMLHHLAERTGDYAGALQVLPPKLLSMFVSAFQSYLFNLALSRRLDEGFALDDPQPGDRLLFANGRTDTVTAANCGAVKIHLKRGRCTIALFMPGKEKFEAKTTGEQATEALLFEYHISPEDFARASVFVRTKYEGAWRPALLRTEIRSIPGEGSLRLKFSLPPGHYATTVCREFMKADPERMI
jgi:tRNA pseudouridine13 synthase